MLPTIARRLVKPHAYKILTVLIRNSTEFRSGAFKPKPEEKPFALFSVVCAVIPGLLIGAGISKSVANFLEENDLFVPADDDEED